MTPSTPAAAPGELRPASVETGYGRFVRIGIALFVVVLTAALVSGTRLHEATSTRFQVILFSASLVMATWILVSLRGGRVELDVSKRQVRVFRDGLFGLPAVTAEVPLSEVAGVAMTVSTPKNDNACHGIELVLREGRAVEVLPANGPFPRGVLAEELARLLGVPLLHD